MSRIFLIHFLVAQAFVWKSEALGKVEHHMCREDETLGQDSTTSTSLISGAERCIGSSVTLVERSISLRWRLLKFGSIFNSEDLICSLPMLKLLSSQDNLQRLS